MSSHQKHLLIFFGMVVLCIAMLWWVIFPAVKSVKANHNQIEGQRTRMQELLEREQSIQKNRNNLALVQSEIEKLDKVFLITGEELGFITDLENIARQNDLQQMINFDNTKLEDETEIRMIPLGLQISGSLDNVIVYINQLENLDYYINIDRIDISASSNQSQSKSAGLLKKDEDEEEEQVTVELSVKLNGLTYWKPQL